MIKESVVLVRALVIMVNQRMLIMYLEVACLSLCLCMHVCGITGSLSSYATQVTYSL